MCLAGGLRCRCGTQALTYEYTFGLCVPRLLVLLLAKHILTYAGWA